METSEQMLRKLKRYVYGASGLFVLIVLWEWVRPSSANTGIFELVGAVFTVLGFWLVDCTEIILTAIKEGRNGG